MNTQSSPDTAPVKKGRAALVITGMFLLPLLNYFGLAYVYGHISGDIAYTQQATLLRYVTAIFSFALPYIAIAIVIASIYTTYTKKFENRIIILLGYLTLFLQYGYSFLIQLLQNTYASDYLSLYAFEFGINFSIDAFLLTVIIAAAYAVKKRRDLYKALLFAALIILLANLAKEIYYTVSFAYELKYEYYTPITFKELLSVISGYIMQIAKCAAGYVVMRLTANLY